MPAAGPFRLFGAFGIAIGRVEEILYWIKKFEAEGRIPVLPVFVHSPMGSGTFRTQKEIEDLFPDLDMVPPGVVRCADWWPDGPRLKELNVAQRTIAGGIGRKP